MTKAVPPRELEIRVHRRRSWTYCFLHGNMIGTELLGPANPIMAVDRNVFKEKSQAGVNENITVCRRIVWAHSLVFCSPDYLPTTNLWDVRVEGCFL